MFAAPTDILSACRQPGAISLIEQVTYVLGWVTERGTAFAKAELTPSGLPGARRIQMKRLVLGFVLAATVAVGLGTTLRAAAGDVCIVHKGDEIWVDESAVDTHINNHGDWYCLAQ